MPFALPARKAHPDLYCHGCGKKFTHRHGAGLYCTAGCEGETKVRQALAEVNLVAAGFVRHANAPHAWVKDGVAVAIEQVLRTGQDAVLEAHAAAVRSRTALPHNS